MLRLIAVFDKRKPVARETFKTAARTTFFNEFEGTNKSVVEGRELSVVFRDSNVEEKFERIVGIPQNPDLRVVQTRLREYGTVKDTRCERYRTVEGEEVMYPVLAS